MTKQTTMVVLIITGERGYISRTLGKLPSPPPPPCIEKSTYDRPQQAWMSVFQSQDKTNFRASAKIYARPQSTG